MESHLWPFDPLSAAPFLRRVIQEIDARGEDEHLELLADFLCAAWGTLRAQNQ
jgi:hypothetical protein